MRRIVTPFLLAVFLSCLGPALSTQVLASIFSHQAALSGRAFTVAGYPIYWPWSAFAWEARWGERYPRPFALSHAIQCAGVALGILAAAIVSKSRHALRPFGLSAWAKFADIDAAGLFASSGAILGRFDDEILAYDGPGHQILIGASR